MPEQATLDLGQRQNAQYSALVFDKIEPGAVAKHALDDGLPAGLVEESGRRAGFDKGVPACVVVRT